MSETSSVSVPPDAANRVFVSVHDECLEPAWLCRVEPFIAEVLRELGISGWEVSVLFCADAFIRELNKMYRNIDAATDVLSFEQDAQYTDEDGALWFNAGDIVISVDTLKRSSSEFAVSEDEELKRLLIHGILHLNGMDHADNSLEQPMLQFQEKVLSHFADIHIIGE